MSRFKDAVQVQTLSGDPITTGDITIVPQSQALTIRWPGGGWVWHRPVAVLVEREGGTERVPIVDITRVAQWAMLGISAICSILTVLHYARERRAKHG